MELVVGAANAAVVAIVGLLLTWYTKGRFDALDARMDRIEIRMDGFQSSLDAMRSDLTQVALTVETHPRAENA